MTVAFKCSPTTRSSKRLRPTIRCPLLKPSQARFDVANLDELPRFFGGLVGYFGYDTVRYVEKRLQPSIAGDRLDTPDIVLMVSEEVVVFDNLEGRMKMISLIDADDVSAQDRMHRRLQEREAALAQPVTGLEHGNAIKPYAKATSFLNLVKRLFRKR